LHDAVRGRQIGVIGSHGAVGRRLVELLRQTGCEVVCGNRTRRSPAEQTAIIDARRPETIRGFAQGHEVVVNCAGPSYLIKDSVAAALPAGVIYVDPFGGNAFDGYAGERACVINVGCTPGLSGLLTRHLARLFDDCESVTVGCGGREQGGVAGFADVILSTQAGYGHPNQMIVDGELVDHDSSQWEAEDTDAFPDGAEGVRSAFVTDELRMVARDCRIRRLNGLLAIPDRDSLHLLLKAMTHSELNDQGELMRLFTEIDAAKSNLDSDKEPWFVLQVAARGTADGRPGRASISVQADNSSTLTAILTAQAVLRALTVGCTPGVQWGHEFLDAPVVMDALRASGIEMREVPLISVSAISKWAEEDESGFI
jgi:hypothetical protein